ncbi:MAG: hypothetical protein LBP40_00385 [Campylobacteraceae bacterium]|jgi:ABC-type protease/lipase transport system fused ATPase/permease subunit|nr:hypothetical protein [Campylobacteraceae bacterium]
MIAWILSLWTWFSKLSWVAKIVSFIPLIKQYWQFIVIVGLVVYIGILKIENIVVENKYLKCENTRTELLQSVKNAQKEAEKRALNALTLIEKNSQNNEKTKAKIEEDTKNESNPMLILRRYL